MIFKFFISLPDQGAVCANPCPTGSYHIDCKKKCDCYNGAVCDHVNGKCHCLPGYKGTKVSNPDNPLLGFLHKINSQTGVFYILLAMHLFYLIDCSAKNNVRMDDSDTTASRCADVKMVELVIQLTVGVPAPQVGKGFSVINDRVLVLNSMDLIAR